MVYSSSSIVLQFAHLQILLNIMSLLQCVQDENNLQSQNMYYILVCRSNKIMIMF
jgi:hypothetical protein